MRRVLLLGIGLGLHAGMAAAQTTVTLTRDYMLCVRRNAEILELSEDPPQDVARAAVFVCSLDEAAAFSLDTGKAKSLRETALFYGAAQATVARACRRAAKCGLAPVQNSN